MSSETQQERRKSVGLKKKLWLKISQIQQKISTQRFKRLSKYPEDKSKTSTLRHGTGKLQKAEDRKHLEISKKAMTPYLEGGNQVIQGRILCLFDMSPSFEQLITFQHNEFIQITLYFLCSNPGVSHFSINRNKMVQFLLVMANQGVLLVPGTSFYFHHQSKECFSIQYKYQLINVEEMMELEKNTIREIASN